ncbi:acid phosphatase [Mycobacterium sp. E1715]|uniref:alkaline phosphatase family protein n=1 Tax=unclassified Mycobacterium TaxID=2642494 RepID=UPI0007FF82D3|nr:MULTISPECIES: alkaline phosphatase family protein [unclassified Mycobacterium]OBG76660.1 acid phosphatase [Mycobacterium sp. E3298]OBH10479.1 acid phosphatase [Mycobacterium sp. E1715]
MRGSTGLTGRAFRILHLLCAVALVGLAAGPLSARIGLVAAAIPQPAHIVIVVEENRSEANIIGNKSAPFITALAASGANMVQSFAETHPSEPNYLAMFAGSTFGVTSDRCPVNAGDAPNLGSELLAAGYTFAGFAEGLPAVGSPACTAGKYARKHVPWANFTNVPPANSLPFSAFPMGNYASLPTVSFVIPNNDDNMHDGSIAQADTWLNRELSGYANWAVANNSLLIVTWDEDDNSSRNQIPTIFYGAHVVPGNYAERINHYNLLSTIEQMYGLPKTGYAAGAPPIADIWG